MECFAKIVKGCNYFLNISFSTFLLYEINIMNLLKTGLIFTLELFVLCKKVLGPRGPQAVDFDMPFTITAFQCFLETFQQLLETSEVEFFLSTLSDFPGSFPPNCLEQVFCKANLRASVL